MTVYAVTIEGRDLNNLSLGPGPAPNPWSFTTGAEPAAPPGVHVACGPTDVVVTWNAVAGPRRISSSPRRIDSPPWPWPQIGTTPATAFVNVGAGADGLTHHYIVRAVDSSGVSGANSTMGVKASLSFQYDGGRTNVHWLSLPYRSMYRRASDLSDELTSSRIDVIGKWDPATQGSSLWYSSAERGVGRTSRSTPGDGFYIGIRSSFEWTLNGTDGEVSRAFTFYPPPNANVQWLSLPFTMSYASASDIVLDIEGSLDGGANAKIVEVAKWDPLFEASRRVLLVPHGLGRDGLHPRRRRRALLASRLLLRMDAPSDHARSSVGPRGRDGARPRFEPALSSARRCGWASSPSRPPWYRGPGP